MLSQLSIKTDPKIKANAQKRASAQGIPLTFVVNTFLREYANGVFELRLVQKKDVDADDIFQSKRIKDAANRVSDFIFQKDL